MVLADRCPTCGESLDTGAEACRVCGENFNAPPAIEPESSDEAYEPPAFLDRLGQWSEIKHEILQSYAGAYTRIVSNSASIRRYVYIDCFAGAGIGRDRETGELLPGSAYRMLLNIDPPFSEYHFIELDPAKAEHLRGLFGDDPRVHIHVGDANEILPTQVLPRCRYQDFARALCLLDPYGLSVNWDTVALMGRMGSIEIFYNFMIVGANRNVLWRDGPQRRDLLTRVFGDEATWMQAAYREVTNLFGEQLYEKIRGNEPLIQAFRRRLKDVAGFTHVLDPIPMKNSQRAVIYYLFFATQNDTGRKIVADILNKYRRLQA